MGKRFLAWLPIALIVILVAVIVGMLVHDKINITVVFEDHDYDSTAHTITGRIADINRPMSQLRLVLFGSDDGQTWEKLDTQEPDSNGSYTFRLDRAKWFLATKQQLVLYAVEKEDVDSPYEELELKNEWGKKPLSLPPLPSLGEVAFDEQKGLFSGTVLGEFQADAYKVLSFGKNGAGWFPLAPPTELTGRSYSIALGQNNWVIAADKEYALVLVEAGDEMEDYLQVREYAIDEKHGPVPPILLPYIDSHEYDEETNYVHGHITNLTSPENYRVVLAITVNNQFWLKPELDTHLSTISANGSFSIRAFSEYPPEAMESDKNNAVGYTLYLVPSSFVGATGVNDVQSVERAAVDMESGSRPSQPGGNSSQPDESSSQPDESSSQPDESSSKPDESSSQPDESSSQPDESSSQSGEPAFDTASITYNENTNSVSGKVTGDVSGCYIILYITVGGVDWAKPTEAAALTSIDSTGAFRMNAFSDWPPEAKISDLTATGYKLYLVKGEQRIGLHEYTGSYLDYYEGYR
jgi:hypothetical protein